MKSSSLKIAILGWGSLIWNPQNLKFDKSIGWQPNGPILPIEFARISNDGRLTLVITDNGSKNQVFYCVSSYDKLDEAILDLAIREGSGRGSIGHYDKNQDKYNKPSFKYKQEIKEWIGKLDIDAVIWTDLSEKWSVKSGSDIIPDNRIEYLKSLRGNTSVIAEEYIRKTPIQIKTKYRVLIEGELNWSPIL